MASFAIEPAFWELFPQAEIGIVVARGIDNAHESSEDVKAALAEANCDDKGLSWPAQIAPFDVHVLATGKGDEVFETAQSLGEQLDAVGLDVLVDDRRKVSAGVKFKDYELVGVPFGLVVGRSLADGQVEIRVRATGETMVVPVEEAVERLREAHAAALKGE